MTGTHITKGRNKKGQALLDRIDTTSQKYYDLRKEMIADEKVKRGKPPTKTDIKTAMILFRELGIDIDKSDVPHFDTYAEFDRWCRAVKLRRW